MKYKKRARPVFVIAPGIIAGAEKVVQTGLLALHEIALNPILIIIRETSAPHFAEQFKKIIPSPIISIVVDSTGTLDFMLPMRTKEALKLIIKKDKSGPLVFHSHGFKALLVCFFIRDENHHIHTHHGNSSSTFKKRIYEKISYSIMKTCNRVIAVSQKMKEELLVKLHPFKKISLIDNMLSFKNINKIRDRRLAVVPDNGNVYRLLFVGRLSPEKGLINFIECWSTLIYRDRFELTIIGDGPEKNHLEKLISEKQLTDKVRMMGHVDDPSEFFVNADLLVMPSLSEGLPMTLIESLATGVPVIASDVGAIASLLIHNHNGYLCQSHALETWADGLWHVLKNIDRWKTNAQNEATSIELRFSAKKWATKTQAFYQV